MASEKEDVEKLLRSKGRVEKRISRLEGELEHLRHLLSVIDKYLAEKSFKVAVVGVERPPTTVTPPTIAKPPTPPIETIPTPPAPERQVIPLRASDGTLLGTIYLGENEIRVIPSENIKFNVNTPPFPQFLVAKVLSGMAAKDREEAMAGAITPDEILTYRVMQDGDILKEVVIRNYRDEKRAATLRNSVRWTLEKMYDKMRL